MAIKQIQLRGISRTPSDRAVADGGCAESLNVHLDYNETAPTLPQEETEISAAIYGSLQKYPIIYIHKMLGVTNYIGHINPGDTYNKGFYAYGSDIEAGYNDMGSSTLVPYNETVKHITSVGNTLIIYTDAKPYYFLYKDHKYVYLGTAIPRPQIEVVTKSAATSVVTNDQVKVALGYLQYASVTTASGTHADVEAWNAARSEGDDNHTELLETMSNVWGAVSTMIAEQQNQGLFVAPFFLRYALRLYDGSYIYASTPILCGAGKSVDWMQVALLDEMHTTEDYNGRLMQVSLQNLFEVRVKGDISLGNWGDIVKSVDFFASEPIYTPAIEASFYNMGPISTSLPYKFDITLDGMNAAIKDNTIKEAVLSKGQFFKIKSIDMGNLSELTGGMMKIEASANVSGELLATQETLPDSYRDGIQYIPTGDAQNFNSRVMLVGAEEMLSRGDMFLNGQVADNVAGALKYAFRYKLVNPVNGNVNYVMARYRDGSNELQRAFFDSSSYQHFGNEIAVASVNANPYAWISYPDTRCTEVEVTFWTNGGRFTYKIPMEAHPLLECAYAFFGFGQSLQSWLAYHGTSVNYNDSESPTMRNDNKLLLSEFENPFVFPAENIVTFKDKLIGAATVSVPLSEGQFGEYPLYAFTEGGIRVLVTTAEGTFAAANAHPNLSRHIAVPGTIMGLEQAVVFTTDKGVMMLSGNQVTELSANMNGMPYVLDDSLSDPTSGLLVGSQWEDLVEATVAEETLMAFMGGAKPAYDNAGGRLLFFNAAKDYQYEYRLATQTWHKVLSGVTQATILNSYPQCLVAYKKAGVAMVANFSTTLTDGDILGSTDPIYGIIATRPFDLGEPDVRKSINDIRIRGRYNRTDVQYVLLGSFDGLSWQRLTSLRGGSYKLFRMVLLTRLTPMERITWIDVDYESRYNNKLR